jgi:1-deoxy-D-xylulose-5-phosphate synthase
MTVASPMNEAELRDLMFTAQQENMGPVSIRYPRGNGVMTEWKTPMKAIKVGTGRKLTNGEDLAILTIGHLGNTAQKALAILKEQGLSVAHYDMRFVKPIDEVMLHEVFNKFEKVITVEDGCLMGGMGSAVLEFMADQNYKAQVVRLGIPDTYIHHGTQEELHAECGFDVKGIVATVHKVLKYEVVTEAEKKSAM